MWTRAKDSTDGKQKDLTTVVASTSLNVDDATAFRQQLNQLREENAALKEALEEVRIILTSNVPTPRAGTFTPAQLFIIITVWHVTLF